MNQEQRKTTEQTLIALAAADRMYVPVSSLDGKLKRQRKKLAEAVELGGNASFNGDRVHARVEHEDREKARSIRDAVDEFSKEFPKYGQILGKMIQQKRKERETHLYFGMQKGARLSDADYTQVMRYLGFSEAKAQELYQPLAELSRRMLEQREEQERSILIGSSSDE